MLSCLIEEKTNRLLQKMLVDFFLKMRKRNLPGLETHQMSLELSSLNVATFLCLPASYHIFIINTTSTVLVETILADNTNTSIRN